jgi:hypothetical protein
MAAKTGLRAGGKMMKGTSHVKGSSAVSRVPTGGKARAGRLNVSKLGWAPNGSGRSPGGHGGR